MVDFILGLIAGFIIALGMGWMYTLGRKSGFQDGVDLVDDVEDAFMEEEE